YSGGVFTPPEVLWRCLSLEVCLHLQRCSGGVRWLSWSKYQPSKQADLLAKPSPASKLTCTYQLGKPVDLPSGLVAVPGQRAVQTVSPLRASGPGPSRSMLEGFWISKQADLLAGLVEVPAQQAV
ncbi:hypothetical protein PCANC_28826, partial [Puccinia coronata f. sp. avenae]